MYAINVADLSSLATSPVDQLMVRWMLQDFVPATNRTTVIIDQTRMDTGAVLLTGPAGEDEERVEALIQLLQEKIGPQKVNRRVRCYRQGPKGGWSEVRPPAIKRI